MGGPVTVEALRGNPRPRHGPDPGQVEERQPELLGALLPSLITMLAAFAGMLAVALAWVR
jgi:hypothetical protein